MAHSTAARRSNRRTNTPMLENLESRMLLSASAPLVTPPLSVTAAAATVHPPLVSALVGPSNLSQNVLGPNSVQLTWTNNDTTATGFWLFRSNDNVTFTQVAKVASPTTTTFTDTSALPFHTYYYKVHVYTAAATSSPSNIVTATTPLGTPTALTLAAKSATSLQLSWANADTASLGYRILRSTDGVTFSPLATVNSGATKTFIDTTNSSSTPYFYKVQSFNGTNSSAISTVATATTPLITPAPFAVTAQSGTAIQISWTNLDPATTGYILSRSLNGTAFTTLATITDPTTAAYTDSNLTPGRTYTYQLQATGALTPSALTAKVAATTPLAAPSALAATTLTANSIRLNWTINEPNAAGFTILRSADGITFTQLAKTTTPAVATYTDTTALPFHTYTYEVLDYTAAINSPLSNTAAATTPLAIPANLAAAVLSPTSIKLTWADSDLAAQGYQIFRSTDGITFSQLTTIASRTTLTFTDTVSSVSSYSYRVVAYNGSATSANSNTVSAATPLGTPAGFAAAITGPTAIRLSWTSADANSAGFTLQRSADGSAFVNLANITTPTQLSYTDSAVMTGHTYAYKLQAYKNSTTSAFTAPATLLLPIAPPSNLTTTIMSPTSVKLNWTANDTSATGFWVFRSTDNVNFTQLIKAASPATTYTDTTALPFHTYYYKVHVYNAAATSSPSNIVTVKTPLAAPTNLVIPARTATSVSLSWSNTDASAAGYDILRSTDNITFNQIATTTAKTFNDTTASSNTLYYYQVKSYNGVNTSAVSNTTSITTPLATPTQLTVTAQSGSLIAVSWHNVDAAATGYLLIRSTDGVNFSTVATITDPAATTYPDSSVLSGRTYYYEVIATTATNASLPTAKASALAPLAAPSALTTTINSPTSVRLNWTGNDANATGYYILRSLNGAAYTKIATLNNVSTLTYTDTSAAAGQSYNYEIQAYYSTATSAATSPAAAITPLATPANPALTLVGGWLKLTWSASTAATGYTILRSTDGTTFTPLATVSSSTLSYVDNTVSNPTTYYYQVQATNAVASSALSAPVSATPAYVDPTGNVTIGTRYSGTELVITANGTADSVSIVQSGSTLAITVGTQVMTQSVPANGVFIYTRGGADTINIDSSVTIRTTVQSIDNAATFITSAGTNVSVWADSTDSFSGTGTLHAVAAFAGGVSKAVGAALANPSDSGSLTTTNASLWGSSPVAGDINQGAAGDCYFLSTLAGFAAFQPARLMESAVDMGDGTYVVQYYSGSTPSYVRVSSAMPAGGWNGFKFEHPGTSGDLWGLVMEKAFCYFRTGANTYASINSGWMGSVYANLNVNSIAPATTSYNDTTLFNTISTALAANKVVTASTATGTQLVQSHAYTILSCSRDSNGVATYYVRNPWGVAGDSFENSQGYATLTFAQMLTDFNFLCIAV